MIGRTRHRVIAGQGMPNGAGEALIGLSRQAVTLTPLVTSVYQEISSSVIPEPRRGRKL